MQPPTPTTIPTRRPGESFEYAPGIILEVQPSCNCMGCFFSYYVAFQKCKTRNLEKTGHCSVTQRTDHQSQIFRKQEA